MINTEFKNNLMSFLDKAENMELNQKANLINRAKLEKEISNLAADIANLRQVLDITTNAIVILREVSDEAVNKSYEFITESINAALERIFINSTRKIRLREYIRAGQYPQLEIELIVEGGKVRSLKNDSGHGLMQIVSLLCILSLIVLTGGRRLLVLDESLSGLSATSRNIVSEILWTFTKIGFQFIISEHGFVPRGAKVYKLEIRGGITEIAEELIESDGIYLTFKTKKDENEEKEMKDGEDIEQYDKIAVGQNIYQNEFGNGKIIEI